MNDQPLPPPSRPHLSSPDPAALHQRLLTIDTHIDIPWPDSPAADPFTHTARCVDVPKMRAGHLAAGCLVAYVPQGPRTPAGHEAATARALAMLATIGRMHRPEAAQPVHIATSARAIRQAFAAGAIAILPAVENGHALGADLANLARFQALGARYLTLTHNGHNDLADSANPRADLGDGPTLHGGLAAFGRQVVGELNRLGMLVDVSHASHAAMLQAVALSATPVIATHSCIRALCDHPRNLDDHQLDALAASGGVVQITAVPYFLRPNGRADSVTVADFCDHIDYAVRRIGIAHVGISSDFDGGGGFAGWRNAAESPAITAALMARGYQEADLVALWGDNFLRLLRIAEASAQTAADTI